MKMSPNVIQDMLSVSISSQFTLISLWWRLPTIATMSSMSTSTSPLNGRGLSNQGVITLHHDWWVIYQVPAWATPHPTFPQIWQQIQRKIPSCSSTNQLLITGYASQPASGSATRIVLATTTFFSGLFHNCIVFIIFQQLMSSFSYRFDSSFHFLTAYEFL